MYSQIFRTCIQVAVLSIMESLGVQSEFCFSFFLSDHCCNQCFFDPELLTETCCEKFEGNGIDRDLNIVKDSLLISINSIRVCWRTAIPSLCMSVNILA